MRVDRSASQGTSSARKRNLTPAAATPPASSTGPIRARWALLVGVDNYIDPAIPNLRFCVNDVLALNRMLRTQGYTTVVLHDGMPGEDQKPTRDNVEAELARLCQVAGSDDLLWVHLACHGQLVDGRPVLITREIREPTLAEKALPLAEVERRMRESGVRRLVLTLDACHTGVDIGRNLADPEFLHNAYELAEGFALLAGSTSQGVAQEWQEQQHGVFSYYLLEGLSGRADRDTKGFVTVDDLRKHVVDGLERWYVEHKGLIQKPTSRIEGVGDMILADHLGVEAAGPPAAAGYARPRPETLFEAYAQAPAALSQHIFTGKFKTLVNERSQGFVGRGFVFEAIDGHLQDPGFPSGYIVIVGEPGIGKTALLAQLVKQKGCVHHFNLAGENIRTPRDFLANVCAQLIVRYGLDYYTLPPEATENSAFLSQLLSEVAGRETERPIVILVDALDEAQDAGLPAEANRLYLPHPVPEGVFFVVTTRPERDYRLAVGRPKEIYIDEKDPRNVADVRDYVRAFVEEHCEPMASRIEAWHVDKDEFVAVITDLSEGNFMYVVHVLGDINDGDLTADNVTDIRSLPRGLVNYYRRHWRVMHDVDADRFSFYYEPVIGILGTVREPVPMAYVAEWTELTTMRVKEVINTWLEFLNVDEGEAGEPLYRIYHASFRDFLEYELGLTPFEDRIAVTGLRKIPGALDASAG